MTFNEICNDYVLLVIIILYLLKRHCKVVHVSIVKANGLSHTHWQAKSSAQTQSPIGMRRINQGCQRSGKSQGKFLFFKVREKSGNSVKSQGKSLNGRKSGNSQGILWWMPAIFFLWKSTPFCSSFKCLIWIQASQILTSVLMLCDIFRS